MEQQAILALGAVTLTGCGCGLLLIHGSNRMLKGLNWMGGALAVGGAAAALRAAEFRFGGLHPLSELLVLLAFACCFRADQYLVCPQAAQSRAGLLLVAAQVALVPLEWTHVLPATATVTVFCALVALQIEMNARLLCRSAVSGPQFPARFTAGLLRILVFGFVVRALAEAAGAIRSGSAGAFWQTCGLALLIAMGVGLSFAFFWRTTARLTGELQHMASTDPLTRVFNRRVFLAWCDKELLRSRESDTPLSVLFVDFDHFKLINDSFGHQTGDEVLCAAVERMQDSIRGIDVLCRWGGEEFAVLLPNAGPEATLIVAERMRQNIRQVNSYAEQFATRVSTDFQLTASIGAASFAHPGDTVEAMLRRADLALYEAKNAGRDRVVLSARPGGAGEGSGAKLGLGRARFAEAGSA